MSAYGVHPFLTRATPTRLLAVYKPHAGELVVGWVTTSESSLLYVFCFYCNCLYPAREEEDSFPSVHLHVLSTTISHLNILHGPEALTFPSPPVLTFSKYIVAGTTIWSGSG
ncbi:hypothetical protein ACN38_g10795 [Penicillium nordicum]|uniref:Uncharacterized protein n=1 Tax=Penicillium nordicum TaxID=229535 RepID=A0A0M8NVV7_9EURO|nr:hypothetical protein ACN38_g10795 [Penicillium nordicum]